MTIDWIVVATIAAPIVALFVEVWVNRRFESCPTLISYFGHVSAFHFTPPGGQLVLGQDKGTFLFIGKLQPTETHSAWLSVPDK